MPTAGATFQNVTGNCKYRTYAPVSGTVVKVALTAPRNVLARNCGDGCLEVQWDAPLAGSVQGYEVWIAASATGTWCKAVPSYVTRTWYRVRNLPFGATVYVKVRAMDMNDGAGPFSDVGLDADATYAVSMLRFTGPAGDRIPAGAVFVAVIERELVGVETLDGRDLQ